GQGVKQRLLQWLASPCCGKDLELRDPVGGEEIASGGLRCPACARVYPIIDGVPRLLDGIEDPGVQKTSESFAWEWTRYPGVLPEDKGLFLEETQFSAEALNGKLTLDAGCGMGRYSKVALSLGAEVIAFDLSGACLRLAAEG